MYSRSETPRRTNSRSNLPSTPSLRPSSQLSVKGQTPSSISRLQSSRLASERTFTPVRERSSRPTSSLSSLSRPTTPSFAIPSQPYTGSIKVAIRAKPSETFIKDPWLLSDSTVQHNDIGEFKFDHVFDPSATNADVYDKVVKNLVESLMDGYNATVFAYGMTGSGKTYSMSGSKREPGVIPLSVREIFNKIDNADKSIYNFNLKVSYLEIYNEKINDLLNVNSQADLKIRDVPDYGVKVIGLTEEPVRSENELLQIIQKGDQNRRTGETDYNTRSSRSHALVLVRVSTANTVTGIETCSTLSLCDLAGSERATTQQERRKEGSFINRSLLTLGSVIVKLSSPATSIGHIPYRDSKLTRLLQPALSGDSVVGVLCTIHTSASALAETVNTIRFAARAKNISLNVRKHETDMTSEKDRMIEKLKQQIQRQQDEILQLKTRPASMLDIKTVDTSELNVSAETKEQISQLTAENRLLVEQLEHNKRLNDERNMKQAVLKNDVVNDILKQLDDDESKGLIKKIDEFFKNTQAEIDEYKSYIAHLEFQLKQETQRSLSGARHAAEPSVPQFSPTKYAGDHNIDSLLRDQEDEIFELRNELAGKEKMIKALQSAKRVRESLATTVHQSATRRESMRFETLRPLNGDRERLHPKLDPMLSKVHTDIK